jgi:hypothetical protein
VSAMLLRMGGIREHISTYDDQVPVSCLLIVSGSSLHVSGV